jgi:RNA polymerase sigma factor (sigma-70 family)
MPGASVRNPVAYLYRMVLNVAADRQRGEQRRLAGAEIDALFRDALEELDPARIAEARSELQALASALEELPPRRRAVFVASRLDGLPHKVIAARLGVTVRVVDRDLKAALDHLGATLDKKPVPRRGPRGSEAS